MMSRYTGAWALVGVETLRARGKTRQQLRRDLFQRIEHDGGAFKGQMGGVGGTDADHGHAGGSSSGDAFGGYLDRQSRSRVDAEPLRGEQVDLRVGLALGNHVAADDQL